MRLYVIAMESEAKDILNQFVMLQEFPYKIYQKDDILLTITSVGKVNASYVLTRILSEYEEIDEIVNIGFAGAYGNYKIGDFVVVDNALYHDFDLTIFGYKLGEVPNIKEDFITKHDYLSMFYDLKRTTLFTGDRFLTTKIKEDFVVDMEGAALYHVAYLYNKPIISVKVVSDVIGSEKHIEEYNEFERNGSKKILELFELLEVRLNEKRINSI